jgi:hypothetical protein
VKLTVVVAWKIFQCKKQTYCLQKLIWTQLKAKRDKKKYNITYGGHLSHFNAKCSSMDKLSKIIQKLQKLILTQLKA